MLGDRTLKWQVLVIQSGKNPAEFNGHLELSFSGVLNGKSWTAALSGEAPAIRVRQYGRIGGEFEVPAQVQIKSVSAKVMDGAVERATQSIKL